ncbi:uncharacterized protein TRIADDRAFT_62132 [Trichoplax adhaerens]|uniref:N-acetyltransferase domain-containing protein n=1 Tax=Trichoplax adhaerens TaxID=10228 RepID=B3SCX7_TRIAD|nr:hypothetical protein TRIADDRAFT_62132 [Trichoplax adhaerens]EDV19397.1 hypothetical protein TRIADDRAFT_62132 [Trichoplax adhaerens]|eukprot:XP_002118086.1 hypothetical protein TRIADDRAFT_62132 [Trichoplax adhaerens]
MASNEFQIVVASSDQVKWIMKMVEDEGWNPGCKDPITFQLSDPLGIFVGLLNGEVIGCVAGVQYEDFGFGGLFIMMKKYRGKGYGMKLFLHALNRLRKCPKIGLDAVLEQVSNYQNAGFQTFHHTMRYIGIVSKLDFPCNHIVDAKSVSFDKLLQYDRCHSPGLRKCFLAAWINLGTDRSLVYLDDNQNIQGFGAIRKANDGYKIGPLYAESFQIAESLIHALAGTFDKCKLALDVPIPNKSAVKLAEKLQLKGEFETVRMCYTQPFTYDWNTVYGLTCLELG